MRRPSIQILETLLSVAPLEPLVVVVTEVPLEKLFEFEIATDDLVRFGMALNGGLPSLRNT